MKSAFKKTLSCFAAVIVFATGISGTAGTANAAAINTPTPTSTPGATGATGAAGATGTTGASLTREEFFVMLAKGMYDSFDASAKLASYEDAGEAAKDSLPYFSALIENGVLAGTVVNDKKFLFPKSLITRQEAFTLVGRAIGARTTDTNALVSFTDQNEIPAFSQEYISRLVQLGITKAYADGSFKPQMNITAADIAPVIKEAALRKKFNTIQLKTYSGDGNNGFSLMGAVMFRMPQGVSKDPNGKLTVFDTYNAVIRNVSENGDTSVAIGQVGKTDSYGFVQGGYTDGDIGAALLNRPANGVYNSKGHLIFTDSENHAVRIVRDGTVETLSGGSEGSADGKGTAAQFSFPYALAVDANDNVYVTDTMNNTIRKIDPTGNTTTIAGKPAKAGFKDGDAKDALFNEPSGITVAPNGAIYISDTGNSIIRKLEKDKVSTVAGAYAFNSEYNEGGYIDGEALTAKFKFPKGLAYVNDVLVIADTGNNTIRALNVGTSGEAHVRTIAGSGEPGDMDGGALSAQLDKPTGVICTGGSLYIADSLNNKIRVMKFNGLEF